jgi:hypothetical protein
MKVISLATFFTLMLGGCAAGPASPTDSNAQNQDGDEAALGFFDWFAGPRKPTTEELKAFVGTYKVKACKFSQDLDGTPGQRLPAGIASDQIGERPGGGPAMVRVFEERSTSILVGERFSIAAPLRFSGYFAEEHSQDLPISSAVKTDAGIRFDWNKITYEFAIAQGILTTRATTAWLNGKLTTTCTNDRVQK